jgi:endonuclease G
MRKTLLLVFLFFQAVIPMMAQKEFSYPEIRNGEVIVKHLGHTISYNPAAMIPVWVAYELRDTDMEGDAQRPQYFSPDPSPQLDGYTLAEHWDYTYSGWVRGHMAPAGDFKYNQAAMSGTFYTTNVCPMDKTFNNSVWKRLEERTRKLALQYGRVYIVTGPIIGTNKNGTVGKSDILVPDAFFKALLVPYNGSYIAIGFYMPNEAPPKGYKLRDYAVTVAELESITGRFLFAALDRKTSLVIKKQLPLKELGIF